MSNVVPPQDLEIDLFEFFETLWDGRWKIIVTTFVAALVGVAFSFVQPNSYVVSTPIQSGKKSVFLHYHPLNDLLKKQGLLYDEATNPNGYIVDSTSIFKIFVSEFNDYEEMVDAVSASEFVKTSIKDVGVDSKKRALINFAKSFKLNPPVQVNDAWTISFKWHNDIEGARLLKEAIRQTLSNVKNSTIVSVIDVAEAIDSRNALLLENLRNNLSVISLNQIVADKKRIQYLKEQSAIANALGIETNNLNANALLRSEQSAFALNLGPSNLPFYLRGYKAIDKEIVLIQKRADEERLLAADDYLATKEQILLLEKDLTSVHFQNMLKVLEADDANNWVEFDLELADFKPQKKPLLYVASSIILGGIVGILYVVISNANRKRKERAAIA